MSFTNGGRPSQIRKLNLERPFMAKVIVHCKLIGPAVLLEESSAVMFRFLRAASRFFEIARIEVSEILAE